MTREEATAGAQIVPSKRSWVLVNSANRANLHQNPYIRSNRVRVQHDVSIATCPQISELARSLALYSKHT